MVSVVPSHVRHTRIISIVLHNLLLRDAIAILICDFTICQINQFVDVLASKGCLTKVRCDRRSHFLEDHHVVLGHPE